MSRRLLISRPGHIYLATYNPASPTVAIDLDLPVAGNPSWFAVSPTDPSLLYTFDENAAATFPVANSNRFMEVVLGHGGGGVECRSHPWWPPAVRLEVGIRRIHPDAHTLGHGHLATKIR